MELCDDGVVLREGVLCTSRLFCVKQYVFVCFFAQQKEM